MSYPLIIHAANFDYKKRFSLRMQKLKELLVIVYVNYNEVADSTLILRCKTREQMSYVIKITSLEICTVCTPAVC